MGASRQVFCGTILMALLALAGTTAAQANGAPDSPPGAQASRDTSTCETPGRSAQERARSQQYRTIRDSAVTLVRGAALSAGVEAPAGLISIALGQGVRTYEGNVPAEVLASVTPLLLDLVPAYHSIDPENRGASLLVRLDPHPLPPCGRRGRRVRDPALRNRGEISRLLSSIAGKLPAGRSQEKLKLGIVLTRDGEIASAWIVDVSTAMTVSDEVLDLVRRMRFRTREIDGVAQDALIYLPITMVPRKFPDPHAPGPGPYLMR